MFEHISQYQNRQAKNMGRAAQTELKGITEHSTADSLDAAKIGRRATK